MIRRKTIRSQDHSLFSTEPFTPPYGLRTVLKLTHFGQETSHS